MLIFGEGRRTPAKRLHMTESDPDADRDEPRMITVESPLGEVIVGPDPDAFARWEAANDD